MKNLNTRILTIALLITVIILGALPNTLNAQSLYKIANGNIKVSGTSNVHDWFLASSTIQSQGDFKLDDKKLVSITSFSFSVEDKTLKSEHESMDGRTYKTMKADKYPRVTYRLTSAVITPTQKNKYAVKATGELTIAGVTQTIVMDLTAVVNDNTITCSGSESLKLTDYKIDPPSFMFGAMKVKNDLVIQFNLVYKN